MGKDNFKKSAEKGSKPAFFKKSHQPKEQASTSKSDSKPDFNKSKFPKRIKRNELVAQKEKQKMLHKYKKMMRKERQQGDKSSSDYNAKNIKFPRVNLGNEDKKYMSVNKKAQLEYENKKKQQNLELEVIFPSLEFKLVLCLKFWNFE
jgi:hypothetical protein